MLLKRRARVSALSRFEKMPDMGMALLYVDQGTLHKVEDSMHADIAQLLIEHGAKVNRLNRDGLTTLHLAC